MFQEQTLDQLADADLLAATIEGFDVYLEATSLELTRGRDQKWDKSRQQSSLGSVLCVIASAKVSKPVGKYSGIGDVDFSEDELKNDPVYRSLLELMRSSEAEGNNRLWIDDRLLNSYRECWPIARYRHCC